MQLPEEYSIPFAVVLGASDIMLFWVQGQRDLNEWTSAFKAINLRSDRKQKTTSEQLLAQMKKTSKNAFVLTLYKWLQPDQSQPNEMAGKPITGAGVDTMNHSRSEKEEQQSQDQDEKPQAATSEDQHQWIIDLYASYRSENTTSSNPVNFKSEGQLTMAKVRVSPGLFKKGNTGDGDEGESEEKVRKCFLAIDFAKSVICVMDLERSRGGNAAIEQIAFDELIEVCSYNVGEANVLKNAISVSYGSTATF